MHDADDTSGRVRPRGISLPEYMWEGLRRDAARRGLSRSALVRLLVTKHLEDGGDVPLFLPASEAAARLTHKQ